MQVPKYILDKLAVEQMEGYLLVHSKDYCKSIIRTIWCQHKVVKWMKSGS